MKLKIKEFYKKPKLNVEETIFNGKTAFFITKDNFYHLCLNDNVDDEYNYEFVHYLKVNQIKFTDSAFTIQIWKLKLFPNKSQAENFKKIIQKLNFE